MEAQAAFKPFGPMLRILASTTPPSATLFPYNGEWTLLVSNVSTTQDAYIVYGPTSAAVAGAVVPAIGGAPSPNAFMLPLPHFTNATYDFSGPTFIGGITPSGNVILDLVAGVGQE